MSASSAHGGACMRLARDTSHEWHERAPPNMRMRYLLVLYSLLGTAHAEKLVCESTMIGDYKYQACGGFCKEARKENHCKVMKMLHPPCVRVFAAFCTFAS